MLAIKRPFVLPYEPEYTAHRTVRRQQRKARLLMRVHMNALHDSPSITPDLPRPDHARGRPGRRTRQPA